MKVALVCDWLTNVGGAEKVLLEFHKLYPDAPIYTSKYDKKGINWFDDAIVKTGWLQFFPTKLRRFLGPLRQAYFNHLNLSEYDTIISVTGAEAKSVKKGNAVHFCYCHVPTQYYWGMYDSYVENPGFGILNPIVRFFFKLLVGPLRRADKKAAQKPDYFITISEYAKQEIKKYYDREAVIIHPPVEVDDFKNKKGNCQIKSNNKNTKSKGKSFPQPVENFDIAKSYVTTSRQVTWKRLDLAIRACLKAEQPLTLIGEGPEHENLVKLANNSELITFLPVMQKSELAAYLAEAKGFLFPSLEPFGIAPVEAIAAGCPVIAYAEGGSRDYVKDGKNGLLFDKQTVASFADAITKFEHLKFDRDKLPDTVKDFSIQRFDKEATEFINEKVKD